MELHVHIHHHNHDSEVLKELKVINLKLSHMAKKTEEIKTLLAEQAATISNLSGDLDRIADRLENDPTETELEEIAADIRSKNEQLKALADRNIVAETGTETPEEPNTPA